jgi:hypothetical protein
VCCSACLCVERQVEDTSGGQVMKWNGLAALGKRTKGLPESSLQPPAPGRECMRNGNSVLGQRTPMA